MTQNISRTNSFDSKPAFLSGAWIQTSVYTALALMCFAANSILCRLALGEEAIGAVSFTAIRLVSGALIRFISEL